MTFVPLGDQALLAYAANEESAVRFAETVRAANPTWLEDVVPAYASVGIFFDAQRIHIAEAIGWLRTLRVSTAKKNTIQKAHVIPVCYEMGPDLARVAEFAGLKPETIIHRHVAASYIIYAIGFVPGFPYLGYLPESLSGVPRLDSPRLRVEPGSVGLTGRQTGIYPLPRPGGWNLIGRTPLTIVDVADGFFPLRVGDAVTFTRIDEAEYRRLDGQRLESG
jgi:inhibitor of KinA